MIRDRSAYQSPLLVHPGAPTLGTGQDGLPITSPGAPRGTNSWYGAGGPTEYHSWCTQSHQLLVRGQRAYRSPPRVGAFRCTRRGVLSHILPPTNSWCLSLYQEWCLVEPLATFQQFMPLAVPGEVSSGTSSPAPALYQQLVPLAVPRDLSSGTSCPVPTFVCLWLYQEICLVVPPAPYLVSLRCAYVAKQV